MEEMAASIKEITKAASESNNKTTDAMKLAQTASSVIEI